MVGRPWHSPTRPSAVRRNQRLGAAAPAIMLSPKDEHFSRILSLLAILGDSATLINRE
jgi:hypothetical protein